MAWWVWALIVWATTASAAVLWLSARRSLTLERQELQAAGRSDLWQHELLLADEDGSAVESPVIVPTQRGRTALPGVARFYRRTTDELQR